MQLTQAAKQIKKLKEESLNRAFLTQLKIYKLPVPVSEFKFHPTRKWRFDFAWIDKKVAVEIEGGTFVGGRHTRAAGYSADCEKYNAATMLGWSIFRFTSDMVYSVEAVIFLEKIFKE